MAASTFEAKVKSVLSGDTVILHNINNPKQERTLSLAFVSAPRLKREGDEPFAFESRDYLRKLLVGKVVRFQVLYKIPTGANREYGLIVLPNRVLLPETAVAEGWLKLRDDAGRKEDSEEAAQLLERLQVVEARARADSKGLWAESSSRINSISELSDAQKWVDEHKGRDIDAIVEKVLAGDRLIVRFLLSPTEHVQTMVLLAGIRAPPHSGRTRPTGRCNPPRRSATRPSSSSRRVCCSAPRPSTSSVRHPTARLWQTSSIRRRAASPPLSSRPASQSAPTTTRRSWDSRWAC
ncbi:hypothetical protein JI435_400410 [Parastagonospora nodorum SN15]|uniref:Probable endonuclease LCL3 n=1 Tax=Phaeosphaeria nodorum (strain SN15 / ATCC MYA-4574 / FGSC 10173) TaxID=321614 RepID=A0A7U2HTS7_PHANO|nr:hypothetical protein JI435_400410 [Parastagonospora nodorum SN15]